MNETEQKLNEKLAERDELMNEFKVSGLEAARQHVEIDRLR